MSVLNLTSNNNDNNGNNNDYDNNNIDLTIELLLKYKDCNKLIHDDLKKFIINTSNKVPVKKHRNHKKNKKFSKFKKPKNKWLEAKKNQTTDEKLYSNIISILNKLTESNFDSLYEELISLDIKSNEHMKVLVNSIFKKAITETNFNAIYAKLCSKMVSYYIKNTNGQIIFRKILVNKCQMMFEECISLDELNKSTSNFRFKDEVLGCIRFIGELYNVSLLTDKIIYSCYMILLSKIDLNKLYIIESICTIITTTADKFSKDCNNIMKKYFKELKTLSKSDKIDKKEKFMLMDLFDANEKNSWINF